MKETTDQQVESFLAKLREIFYPGYQIPLWLIVSVLFIGFVLFVGWRFANWRANRLEVELRDEHERHSYFGSEFDHEREAFKQKEEALLSKVDSLESVSKLTKLILKALKRNSRKMRLEAAGSFESVQTNLDRMVNLLHGDMGRIVSIMNLLKFQGSESITPAEHAEVSQALLDLIEDWGTPENPDGTPITLSKLDSQDKADDAVYIPALMHFTSRLSSSGWQKDVEAKFAEFVKENGLRLEDISWRDDQDEDYYILTVLYPKRVEPEKS